MKKKILILLLLLLIPLICLCSCEKIEIYESGDFSYSIIKENGEEMAAIRCLSSTGKEKEVIVIPEYLDGYKVYGCYDRGSSTQWGFFTESKAKKIFIQHHIEYGKNPFSFHSIFFLGEGLTNIIATGSFSNIAYLPSNVKAIKNEYDIFNANVTYYVDEEIYWIDDYDNSLITFIPENPTKEGYTFDGWYKDNEYQNKWDFDADIIPEKEYDIDHEYVYKETKLYAKFI